MHTYIHFHMHAYMLAMFITHMLHIRIHIKMHTHILLHTQICIHSALMMQFRYNSRQLAVSNFHRQGPRYVGLAPTRLYRDNFDIAHRSLYRNSFDIAHLVFLMRGARGGLCPNCHGKAVSYVKIVPARLRQAMSGQF